MDIFSFLPFLPNNFCLAKLTSTSKSEKHICTCIQFCCMFFGCQCTKGSFLEKARCTLSSTKRLGSTSSQTSFARRRPRNNMAASKSRAANQKSTPTTIEDVPGDDALARALQVQRPPLPLPKKVADGDGGGFQIEDPLKSGRRALPELISTTCNSCLERHECSKAYCKFSWKTYNNLRVFVPR